MILLRYLFGDVLRRHRLRQGRTLREVSAAARISLGYLSEVERGQKEASSELLTAICAALGIKLSDALSEVAEQVAGFEPETARETVGDGAAMPATVPASPETALPPAPEPVGAVPAGVGAQAFASSARYPYAVLEPRGLHRGVFGDTFPAASV